jgi:hypothetical protein
MAVELPILLTLCVGSFLLCRTWLSDFGAAVTTLVVALNAAVLGYSVMLNPALLVTTAVAWSFATYLRSKRLMDWPWSIAFGAVFALLLLARTNAPVYAVPLALVVLVDLLIGIRRDRWRPGWPLAATVGVVLVVAGPWWLVSGGQAWQYLTNAGYQASSGFTSGGIQLSPSSIIDRSKLELSNLGWAEAAVLGILVLASVLVVLRHRNRTALPKLWLLASWVVLTLLVLSSSGNAGTAFGLPLIAMVIVICGAVLGVAIRVGHRPIVMALVVLLLVGAASQFSTSTNPWWHGPPYKTGILISGGSGRLNTDQLNAEVAQSLGRGNAITALDDPLLNPNGLIYFAPAKTKVLLPQGSNSTAFIISKLPDLSSLVTGTEPDGISFDGSLHDAAIEAAAYRAGFRPTRVWKVSEAIAVIVWHRHAENPALAAQSGVRGTSS